MSKNSRPQLLLDVFYDNEKIDDVEIIPEEEEKKINIEEKMKIVKKQNNEEPQEKEKNKNKKNIELEKEEIINEEGKKITAWKGRNFHIVVQESNYKYLEQMYVYFQHFKEFAFILASEHNKEKNKNKIEKKVHAHIFVQYKQPVTITTDKIHFSHIGKTRCSAQANVKYLLCKDKNERHKEVKAKMLFVCGTMLIRGGLSPISLIQMIEGGFRDAYKYLDARYYNVYKNIINDWKQENAVYKWAENVLNHDKLEVEWHTGRSGHGKTTAAAKEINKCKAENIPCAVVGTDKNGFAHPLGNMEMAETLIINEFRDSEMPFKKFLEVLTNEHIYNLKGSQCYVFNLKKIIVTSVFKPWQLYRSVDEEDQIKRRITKTIKHWKDENDNYHSKELKYGEDDEEDDQTNLF